MAADSQSSSSSAFSLLRKIKRALIIAISNMLRSLCRSGSLDFYASVVQRLEQDLVQEAHTSRGKLLFFCANSLAYWRANTLLTKEPDTIEWIDSFTAGDYLWDIGANIGVYSLYAASVPGVRVWAFEPASMNYALLSKNIHLNGLSERVQAFCLAFNHETTIDSFNLSSTETGTSLHSFGVSEDFLGAEFQPAFKQGVIGYSIDDFVMTFNPAFPTHIKIDVDGIEEKIVVGAQQTLADPRLRSVLVEMVDDRANQVENVTRFMELAGLALLQKKQSPLVEGRFMTTYNYLFVRK
jgi:FkbM family methyltransferase